MEIAEQIKKNRKWFIWGGIALGIFVLFILFSRPASGAGGEGGSSGPSEALQAKQLEIQGQLSLASMQLAAQESAGVRELAIVTAQMNQAAQIADMQTAAQLEAMAIQSAENRYLADRQFEATMAQISSQETLAIAQAEAAAFRDKLSAELQIANLETMRQMNRDTLYASVDLEAIRAGRDVQTARISADAQKHGSTMGMIGGLFSGLFGLFSEAGLKKNIKYEGQTESGLSRYSYEYLGSQQRHYGVLAEEAEGLYPGAVYRDGGHIKVDYGYLLDNLNRLAHNPPVAF